LNPFNYRSYEVIVIVEDFSIRRPSPLHPSFRPKPPGEPVLSEVDGAAQRRNLYGAPLVPKRGAWSGAQHRADFSAPPRIAFGAPVEMTGGD